MCKYYFQTKSFLKNNLLVKALEPLFAVLSSDLKQRYFFLEKKKCNIDYSSPLPYLTDVNWLYISCKVTKKVIWEQQTRWLLVSVIRSSRPEVFCKKGILRNFTKSTRKYLCRSLFFNKACNCIKEEFCEISKNTFLHRTPLVAALCYWKFNTEVAISEFFEKLCRLIID